MGLQGRKTALFVADLYEDMEYWYPFYRLKEESAEVVTIGPRAETYSSKHGLPARADLGIADAKPEDYAGLVIPGGYAPDHMRRVPAMVEFTRAVHARGGPVAAICHAGWMLASADLLRGREATSFFSIKDDMVNAGAAWVDREVVEDGGIITSRSPADLPAFCRAVIRALG
jgi:protease I